VSTHSLSRREIVALVVVVAVFAAWLLMPVIRQPQEYHAFADQRAFLGIPHAADVISNLALVAAGLFGLWRTQRTSRPLLPITRASLVVSFAGMALSGFGSIWYHLSPTDVTLVWDRLPMTIAFAGVYGAMFAERISARAGLAILLIALVVGPASVVHWAVSGNLSLYLVVQFGLVAGVLLLLVVTRGGPEALPWGMLLFWYVIAKVAETADASLWNATGGVVAGHMVKHVAAAIGGFAIALALRPGDGSTRGPQARQAPGMARGPAPPIVRRKR
jgi:hypothetical protein